MWIPAYIGGVPITTIPTSAFAGQATLLKVVVPDTVMSIGEGVFKGCAVLQDITRETIQDRFPDVPVVTPESAAFHLFNLARGFDFTLFEFFQTDVAGHTQDFNHACSILRFFDRFLSVLTRYTEAAGITLVMTSDHGNIENMSAPGHSRNPVPFIAFGPQEKEIRNSVKTLVDVTPAILKFI
jgi:2,3-bisphosphoglycerate-independent phosphoglycerate mutase